MGVFSTFFAQMKVKKKVIQFFFSISRPSRGHMTSDQKKKIVLFKLSFERKNLKEKIVNNCFSPPDGARELKLRPFDSESKTTSVSSNSLISKRITPNSLFSLYSVFFVE